MGRFVVKNVNFFLIIMIIVVITVSTGISLYYERRFTDLSQDYVITLQRMQEAEKYQGLYLDAIKSLNTTEQSIDFYDELYENKTIELASTKEELTEDLADLDQQKKATEAELKRTQDSLDNKIDELNEKKAQLKQAEDNLEDAQDEADQWEAAYNKEKDEVEKWKDKYYDADTWVEACIEDYPACEDLEP